MTHNSNEPTYIDFKFKIKNKKLLLFIIYKVFLPSNIDCYIWSCLKMLYILLRMEEPDQLESIKTLLSSTDFIMEPNVGNLVKSYVQAGGKPNDVVALLSDNYKAIAQHVNLLAEWLILR